MFISIPVLVGVACLVIYSFFDVLKKSQRNFEIADKLMNEKIERGEGADLRKL
jgi:hypothetical protein